MTKNNKWYWYHYDNRGKINNDYPYNQYDEEEYHEQEWTNTWRWDGFNGRIT